MALYSDLTLKKLFALSKNQCAFPDCREHLINSDGIVIGEICHIKARSANGPRFDQEITEHKCNSFPNLILLCSKHHKIIDSQPHVYTVDILTKFKEIHEKNGRTEFTEKDLIFASLIVNNSSKKNTHIHINESGPIIGSNVSVTIKNPKSKVTTLIPINCIGSDSRMRGYAKHLIDRYNEFSSYKKENFKHSVIYANIKQEFSIKWDWINQNRFEELINYLQNKIDNTIVGKMNISRRKKNYSSYEEYINRL